ncbi:MAG: Tol-Pal system beta propeller repeat protein TolB [Rhodobacteraceae bacterium]|nr:Tol-Pal system beta propeller repeat protein TolB [Paracoccaceae bacterium]
MRPLALFQTLAIAAFATGLPGILPAQSTGPLRIEITEGVIEPMPFAVPAFVAEDSGARALVEDITAVVVADLVGSGIFREIPRNAHISGISNFDSPVQFSDWKAVNAQALITGAVSLKANGQIAVKFRLFDVFAQAPLGEGLQFAGQRDDWRRMAHKVADAVYSRLTGESGYFDSRVVFVSETGPKDARRKRLAIMDYDGANVRNLTDDNAIVLAPRFSPDGQSVLYTSYETGMPRVFQLDLATMRRHAFDEQPGMTFAPRYSPDGRTVLMSLSEDGNTDIYSADLAGGSRVRLTSAPSIETAPSYAPDGRQIVFESDRGGSQQLYIMPAGGGEARRISFGAGRYGTPVWSPRGDLIAFTKIYNGRFHIGVMRIDGSEERLLTASFLDEAPTWSPNGRVLMFFRETRGVNGAPSLYSVDITGRNLKRVPTPGYASDPSWSGLLR